MNRVNRAISLWTVWLAACSGELRAKPVFECDPEIDAMGVVCSDGLIGSCVNGFQRVTVCGDTTVCEATWQEAGAYKCGPNDALEDSGTTIYAKDELEVSLEAATLRVLDDSNGDGVVSPGEHARLSISIRNVGRIEARMVSGAMSTPQPGVTLANAGALHFGDIDVGATACASSSQSFAGNCDRTNDLPQLMLTSTVAVDTPLQIELAVTDADSRTFDLRFALTVGTID